MNVRDVTRVGVAGIWLHQGVWKKILSKDTRHTEIVESVPGLSARTARIATMGLGLVEAGLAGWVLSTRRQRLAAFAQTALVVGMNTAGLAFSREAITRPGRLISRNIAFLSTVWAIA
jgi:hypothetical protein